MRCQWAEVVRWKWWVEKSHGLIISTYLFDDYPCYNLIYYLFMS
jgi:hypothetical protein